MNTIKVHGKNYPCYETMGAYMRYKRLTDTEASQLTTDDISGCVTWLWCLTASACASEGEAFDLDPQAFADGLTPAEFAAWSARMAEGAQAPAATEEKKS